MRAPGCAPGMLALECAMDELAIKLGMDPLALRIKNDAELYPGRNVPWSSKNLRECYEIGADKFDGPSETRSRAQSGTAIGLSGSGWQPRSIRHTAIRHR